MKIDELTNGVQQPITKDQVDEAVNIQHVNKDEHFIGVQPGTEDHSIMVDVMKWTKKSDPELYKKIMNLD